MTDETRIEFKHAEAPAPAAPSEGYSPAEVRAWAKENDYPVGARGRLSADAISAFLASREG